MITCGTARRSGVPDSEKGSALVEAIIGLWVFLLSTGYFVELGLRGLYEIRAWKAAFILARQTIVEGAPAAGKRAMRWLEDSGQVRGKSARQQFYSELLPRPGGSQIRAKVWFRYPGLLCVSSSRFGRHHHFELSRTCTLSLQSY